MRQEGDLRSRILFPGTNRHGFALSMAIEVVRDQSATPTMYSKRSALGRFTYRTFVPAIWPAQNRSTKSEWIRTFMIIWSLFIRLIQHDPNKNPHENTFISPYHICIERPLVKVLSLRCIMKWNDEHRDNNILDKQECLRTGVAYRI